MSGQLSRERFEEIAAEVAKTAPAGLSEQEFMAHVLAAAEKAERPGMIGTGPGGAGMVPDPVGFNKAQNAAHVSNLPMYAGLGAGIATGGAGLIPATVATMGAGGAGSVAKQALEGRDITAGETLSDMAEQGLNEVGGRLPGLALKHGGKAVYNLALSPARRLKSFGDVTEAAIEGGAVIPTSKRFGVDKLKRAREASAKEAEGMLAGKLPPGARIKVDVALQELNDLRKQVRMNPKARADLAAIDAFETEVRASHPKGFTPEEFLKFKQNAFGKSDAAFKAAEHGDLANQMEAEGHAAVGTGARKFLETLAPASKAANKRTAALMGAERAAEDASGRGNMLRYAASVPVAASAAMLPGVNAAGGLALGALSVPQIGGPVGYAANKAGKFLGRAQIPNVARVIELLKRQQTLDQLGSEP